MTKGDIISKVKSLNLPGDSYVVFGSGPLAALDIRETNDIDLYVSKKTRQILKEKGWSEQIKGPDDRPLHYDVFDAHDNWNFSPYNPTLDQLLQNAIRIDGVAFASLEDVKKWKTASGRPKDIVDLELIERYLVSKDSSDTVR